MRNTTLLAALASTLILSACGIKGSLYLPEPPAAPAAGADHSKDDPKQAPTQ
ncbi:lipoprotein [Thauera sp. CAU 1555]|jgi:predicted small lipoprotein YifL|uniref:Lipoprotein n=1 Tax=Thauera sedimentorum TaxID=2767595 RepID=A0ABR9BAY7_9RHOO|nr:lipoprotein [Thauera sedimentorum]MBC9072585.1 lipoprotein [Thauera sedimentorum]MBD8503504.1 lipoprotein [Thauera sedimentorum]